MTEAVSKAGGVLGWWMNSMSHSKMCTCVRVIGLGWLGLGLGW